MFLLKVHYFVILVFLPLSTIAQKFNVGGIVKDGEGNTMPMATVLLIPDSAYTTSDENGAFSLSVRAGNVSLIVSYTGYESHKKTFVLRKDVILQVTMRAKIDQLKVIEVVGQKYSQQDVFESTRTGTTTLTRDDINAIPVLGGEADIIKTLQLLPGVIRGIEGTSDLFVRGGAADQNLLLLDDAPIYNSSHLFGFLSVFNPDILDKVDAVNGGFPAEYGGRLSSILDVKTRPDIAQQTHVTADIGLIASRLYVEQPLIKNKMSVWVAGRRTYIDRVVSALSNFEVPYFFYDLNGKLIFKPSARDNIQFSHYTGDDVLDYFSDQNNDDDGVTTTFHSGNNSQSLRWDHDWVNGWRSHVTLIRSKYRYTILNSFEENTLTANSDIEDTGAKILVEKDSVWGKATIKAGIDWTHHQLQPNLINTTGAFAEFLQSTDAPGRTANEAAIHVQQEWSPKERWLINTGIRATMGAVTNKVYINPEPRFSARYTVNQSNSLKFSYSRMVQCLHRVSSSAVSTPTDLWYPVTDKVKPQTSHQVSAAWQRFFSTQKVFLGVEVYYKKMNQLVGYEEGTNLFFNNDFESKLIQGKGRAYGAEFLLRKEAGKFTGWISYTLSWSYRQFDGINNGNWFHARYDRRHNGAVVTQYAFAKRWAVSAVWEFISGSRFTPIIGQYAALSPSLTGFDLIPVYAPINSVKLADTHRLDLGIKFKSRPEKKIQWQWFAGVYNAYNRSSPIGVTIELREDGSLGYLQPGLFGSIPFISYGVRF